MRTGTAPRRETKLPRRTDPIEEPIEEPLDELDEFDEPAEAESTDGIKRRIKDTRESISQTAYDIKDTVEDKYGAIKDVVDTLNWREQVARRPLAWVVGTFSVSFLVSYTLGERLQGTKAYKRVVTEVGDLQNQFFDEVRSARKQLTKEMRRLNRQVIHGLSDAALGTVIGKVHDLTGFELDKQLGLDKHVGKKKKKNGAKKNNH
jgi:gas vesicle protein